MKALSLHQPWASMISDGRKTIETRIWRTNYRSEKGECVTGVVCCGSGRKYKHCIDTCCLMPEEAASAT